MFFLGGMINPRPTKRKDMNMGIAQKALDGIWNHVADACYGVRLETPAKKSTFTVAEVRPDELVIILNSDDTMKIGKAAFEGALRYLLEHGHHDGMRCEIRSHISYDQAGPLCRAARTNGTCNSTYVLPILKKMGLVGIDAGTSRDDVSKAWYLA
jgi:hypothetical protein